MVTFPNAKINIGLDILRKRADGYHDISTVMMPIPWKDILEIVPSKGDSDTLVVSGRDVNCAPEQNIVLKAVAAMRKVADFPAVDIFLHKVIPDGAGLGGGSADAAFTLVMLNDMFSLGLESDGLADIAATLGADCPFFVVNRPMLCEGTGTDMSCFELSLPTDITLVVIKPPVSVPTRIAYSAVSPQIPEISLERLLHDLEISQWQGRVKNDFERSVMTACPIVGTIKEALLGAGATYASMSGSGSAVYGLFLDADCDTLAGAMKSLFPEYDMIVERIQADAS